MRRSRPASPAAALLALWLCVGCSPAGEEPNAVPREPRLPDGEAGEVLGRAIEAAGGWERWRALDDVAFISMMTVVDPVRSVSSENIGWFSAPLHDGARARMDSLGLPTEVRFGIDNDATWIVSDGVPITAPGQLALTRFDLTATLYWFSLPFSLAERPATITYAGEEIAEDGRRWRRLRVEYAENTPGVPGPWFVVYFDAESGLIDRVHGRLIAPFLRHELWVGQWLRYRDCGGIKKERLRQFFPADADGTIIGGMVAEQFIERVRFNNGYGPEHFERPPAAVGATPAGEAPPGPPPGGTRLAAVAGWDGAE